MAPPRIPAQARRKRMSITLRPAHYRAVADAAHAADVSVTHYLVHAAVVCAEQRWQPPPEDYVGYE